LRTQPYGSTPTRRAAAAGEGEHVSCQAGSVGPALLSRKRAVRAVAVAARRSSSSCPASHFILPYLCAELLAAQSAISVAEQLRVLN